MSANSGVAITLGRSYRLENGLRVRLRLARSSDAPVIAELLEIAGVPAEELARAALVRHDPRTRLVVCATALIGSTETLIGIGAIDLDSGEVRPELLVLDPRFPEAVGRLLTSALVGRAEALARRRAA
jgi:hypothetical protein